MSNSSPKAKGWLNVLLESKADWLDRMMAAEHARIEPSSPAAGKRSNLDK